jgi:hypothetical protein
VFREIPHARDEAAEIDGLEKDRIGPQLARRPALVARRP